MKRYLDITRLSQPAHRVSHLVLGQWHWAPDRSEKTLFLNDFSWDTDEIGKFPPEIEGLEKFGIKLIQKIRDDVKTVQRRGIKVLAELQNFWDERGFGGDDKSFEKVYAQVHRMLHELRLDGVDLDVENQNTNNARAEKLIRRLRKDFPHLIISMAPVGAELNQSKPLSSINYPELYAAVGSDISWFHVQLYNGLGSLDLQDFESFLVAKENPTGNEPVVFPAEKLILMVQTNPTETGGRHPLNKEDEIWTEPCWTSGAQIEQNWGEILRKYPKMGGLGSAEWYNAVWEPVETDIIHNPEQWFVQAHRVLKNSIG